MISKPAVDEFRGLIGARFGRNKTEEICRLCYEISRRESIKPAQAFQEALLFLSSKKTKKTDFQNIPFSRIKRFLLKRRFPSLPERELSRVYLTPLNLSVSTGKEPQSSGATFCPLEVFVEKKVSQSKLVKRIIGKWPEVPVKEIDSLKKFKRPKKEWLRDFGKRTLTVALDDYDLVKRCPCTSRAVSCNYQLLNIGFGCPYDCSYCYLQEYQNVPAIILPASLDPYLERLKKIFENSKPPFFTRIGTGEYSDSLALDWLTEYSKILVPFFKDKPAVLELKTKSDCIQNLIGLDHGGNTVIAWSLNPKRFAKEEKGAAPVLKRLEAAKVCEQAGYGTAFHFDPILPADGWEKDYEKLIEQLFSCVSRSVRWISLGMLRYHKDLRRVAEFRHSDTEIFLGEERLDAMDGKMRSTTERRVAVYRQMINWIRRYSSTPVYLCMESSDVWKAVFGNKPFQGRIDEWIISKPIEKL